MSEEKHIFVLGLNHRQAPVAVREVLAFSPEAIPEALHRLVQSEAVEEALILSTCNRTEIYAVGGQASQVRQALENFVRQSRPQFQSRHHRLFYFYRDEEAIRHIFRVAAGLDSMVLGEPQIFGQVKEAFSLAQSAGSTGPLLNRLLHATIVAGKRVRTETSLGEGAVSVAYAAVELALKIYGDLHALTGLLLGAGETGQLTARHLKEKKIGRLYIVNRTYERAQELARQLDGEAVPMNRLLQVLPAVDLIIGSTSSPDFLLRADQLKPLVQHRSQRPLFLIDIAVPRDFDPAINRLPNVFLHDIDDLQNIVQQNLKKRQEQIPKAEKIIAEELGQYLEWQKALKVKPTIVALRHKLEKIREMELEKFRHKVSPEEFEHMKKLTHGIINKILHMPITQLRKYANGHQEGMQRIDVVREIFDLEQEDEGNN